MAEITAQPQRIPSGEQATVIPPEFLAAAGVFGHEPLMRRMMRDPWLGLAFAMVCALVLEGEHRIVPAIGDLPPNASSIERREKAIADNIAAFHRRWIGNLKRPLRRTLYYSMEALPYGHKLCEIEWGVAARGEDRGRLTPVDIAPKPRTAYTLRVDNANRLTSVRPEGGSSDGSGDVLPTSLFVFSLCGRDDHPNGTPALERAYEAWYRKGCAKPNETKAIAAFAGGVAWGEAEPGTTGTVDFIGPDGKKTPRFLADVVAEEGAKLRVGRFVQFPAGVRIKHQPPAPNFGAFDSTYRRSDTEMIAAFFVAARAVMESQFGSRADSETAEGMLESIRDWLRGELCEEVRSQLLMVATVANFGEEARRYCPSYDITTEERRDLEKISAALQQLDATGILTPDLADYLLSLAGVPESVRRSVMALIEGADQAPEEDTDPTQFADPEVEDPTERARAPKVEKRTSSRANRATTKLVKRYDRSLRKSTARWLDSKLSDAEFVEDFTEQLTRGHEEAAKIGVELSGFKGARLPVAVREYVAATLGDESEYLRKAIQEFHDGARSAAQMRLAARRYAKRMSGTVAAAFHEASPTDSEFWWQLGGTEHCKDCPRLAAMSPFLKDELITRPREGETECFDGCTCRLIRQDGVASPSPVTLGGYG